MVVPMSAIQNCSLQLRFTFSVSDSSTSEDDRVNAWEIARIHHALNTVLTSGISIIINGTIPNGTSTVTVTIANSVTAAVTVITITITTCNIQVLIAMYCKDSQWLSRGSTLLVFYLKFHISFYSDCVKYKMNTAWLDIIYNLQVIVITVSVLTSHILKE